MYPCDNCEIVWYEVWCCWQRRYLIRQILIMSFGWCCHTCHILRYQWLSVKMLHCRWWCSPGSSCHLSRLLEQEQGQAHLVGICKNKNIVDAWSSVNISKQLTLQGIVVCLPCGGHSCPFYAAVTHLLSNTSCILLVSKVHSLVIIEGLHISSSSSIVLGDADCLHSFS